MTTDALKPLRLFFGDQDRDFLLTPDLIEELERLNNAGIGAIFARLTNRQFRHGDILQTLRLALIGGGETPQRAASLVHLYGAQRPLVETLPLAVAVFENLFFGEAKADEQA